jgi:putative DNA primase/helicase
LMGKEAPRDCRENVIYVLRDHPAWRDALAIDTFASRIVTTRATPLGHAAGDEWTSDDESALALWMSEQEGLTVRSLDTVSQSVRHVALLRRMHPVQDYFNALEWDGRNRVGRWAVDFMDCADDEYSRLVGAFFLINVVRRIYEPGCVMRSVPVFEGAQNKGKSRALWTLANPWYADTMLRIGDKDAYQLLQGILLYEISEMDSFSRGEASAVKAFISSTEDRFRAPYERAPTTHRRQTSFAATTNAAEYLKDWTGNTRFWPLSVGEFIDLEGLAIARDQLWAEAIHLYRQGVRAYPTQEQERALFKPEQDKRMIVHPWQEMIADFVVGTTRTVSTREIMQDCLKVDMSRINPQGSEAQRVGQILNALGYTKAQTSVVGRREWVWKPPVVLLGGSDGVAF